MIRSKIIKSIYLNTEKIFIKGYFKKKLKKLLKKNVKREILFSCVVPKAFKKSKISSEIRN